MQNSISPESYLIPTYKPQPISFVRGEGSWLYTAEGDAYLDALTGIAVCGLGHCHPKVSDAISKQAGTLMHTSNLYQIDWQEKAAKILCDAAQMDLVFFANSGAEANEAALKMARLYAHNKGYSRPKVIVMEKSFHGRTLLTVSATANPKAREGFFTLDDDFIRVPFGDIDAIKAVAKQHNDIVAVLLEPIQGEGGLNTASNGFEFLNEVGDVCDANDWLFMIDEVQTGNGRTGKFFAYQYSDAKPDVLTTAKGLGNGFPVGACMVQGRAKSLLEAGSHGSTYGGSPLASRVVYAVYNELSNTDIMQNALKQSEFIKQSIIDALSEYNISCRGHGMMIGIVLPVDGDYTTLVDKAREEENILINLTGGHVIRLLPALNLSHEDSQELVTRLVRFLKTKLN